MNPDIITAISNQTVVNFFIHMGRTPDHAAIMALAVSMMFGAAAAIFLWTYYIPHLNSLTRKNIPHIIGTVIIYFAVCGVTLLFSNLAFLNMAIVLGILIIHNIPSAARDGSVLSRSVEGGPLP